MALIAIDAGHGGEDAGGQSLGKPEKDIALAYAEQLATELQRLGHRVLMTRTRDVFISVSDRARIANEAGAHLFVSLHANASVDPRARGPWTIHAAPSAKGRDIAEKIQAALFRILAGRKDAVYPDESPWVGNRRMAVLRQTKMPAVLLELGFMTNPVEIRQLESPLLRVEVCAEVADAIDYWLDGKVAEPKVVGEPLVATVLPPNLEKIILPTKEHFEAAAKVRGFDPGSLTVLEWAEVAEAVFRIMARSGVKAAKMPADVLARVLEEAA